MNVNQTYSDIQALDSLIYQINKRQPDAIAELNRLYRIVYGETVVAGCSNCHIKAFKKLMSLTIKDLNIMENQNFKIKKDKLVEFPFHSGQFFSSALGITDMLAIEYLTAHPKLIENFEVYPGSETESKELDLSLLSKKDKAAKQDADPVEKEIGKMNKAELQAKYAEVLAEPADESLTKNELIAAIEGAKKDKAAKQD